MKVSDYARERIKMLQASIPDPQMQTRDLSMLLDMHVGKNDETVAELLDAPSVSIDLDVVMRNIDDEFTLRHLLWLRHGCDLSALYGDDGEMQCHGCRIDFLRDPARVISKKFTDIGIEMLRISLPLIKRSI
jgi:hypothetical protein